MAFDEKKAGMKADTPVTVTLPAEQFTALIGQALVAGSLGAGDLQDSGLAIPATIAIMKALATLSSDKTKLARVEQRTAGLQMSGVVDTSTRH